MQARYLLLVACASALQWTGVPAQADGSERVPSACESDGLDPLADLDGVATGKSLECIDALARELSLGECVGISDENSQSGSRKALICAGLVSATLKRSNATYETRASARSGLTLERVRQRGYLVCGVNRDTVGFSERPTEPDFIDEERVLYRGSQGLEADLCRVVAIAVFGEEYDSDRVAYKEVDLEARFSDLRSRSVDVVFRSTTWNSSRDTGEGVDFGPVYFHDGQKFLVRRASGITELRHLANRPICVQSNTTTKSNLESVFSQLDLELTLSRNVGTYLGNDDLLLAFLRGSECDAVAGDESTLLGLQSKTGSPDAFTIIPDEPISYEPLAAMIAEGDAHWSELVDYAINATIWAEQERITQAEPRIFAAGTWESLGLDVDTGFRIVRTLGNYGEMFERHLGDRLPGGRGRNQPSVLSSDGWMIVPPMESAVLEIIESLQTSFAPGSYRLAPATRLELEAFVARVRSLELDEIVSIEVLGYTDDVGLSEANMRLSDLRASAVGNALSTYLGVEAITSEGRGESEPVATNETPEGRALNRRVEVSLRGR